MSNPCQYKLQGHRKIVIYATRRLRSRKWLHYESQLLLRQYSVYCSRGIAMDWLSLYTEQRKKQNMAGEKYTPGEGGAKLFKAVQPQSGCVFSNNRLLLTPKKGENCSSTIVFDLQ